MGFMRVAIYTRLSPNPNKDDTTNQVRDLEEYVKRMGWEIVGRYTDIHVSGSKSGKERTEFKVMMEDAAKRKFDVVLFWSLDRLSREGVYQTLTYLKELSENGVEYKSYTEQYLDTCGMFKDAVISIIATIAKQERVRLVERTRAGLATAIARGVKLGRPRANLDARAIKKMMEQKLSQVSIAKRLGVDQATISRFLRGNK
jgi:DNA invertase Pin-like site-specific DNA recombinase